MDWSQQFFVGGWGSMVTFNYVIWVVVSNMFYFHPYLGKISVLTNIFQMGWNHQLSYFWYQKKTSLVLMKRKGLGVSHGPAWLLQVYIVSEIYEVPPHLNLPKNKVTWETERLNFLDEKIHKPSQPVTLIAKPVRFAIPGAADCGREPTPGLCRYCCLGESFFPCQKGLGR